ncbi:putative negative regulator of RcsB-dependent stress response [Neisseria sp. HSC-16F19]|nr:tetratricopeptide repeat protein [Neisseria sp. HSC-16F19]MCP2040451.1 putative negative regulator of RcsB-dependent stress response [Neisseria sp. HSC-16F19]
MAQDFHDQEEIENFKYFWRRYGRWGFYLLLAAAAAYLGWVIYQGRLQDQRDAASRVFDTFVAEAQADKETEAKKQLIVLQQEYGNTLVAAQATLMMAGTAFDQGKYEEAAQHLKWVQGKHKDGLIRALATQRLAVVYLQEQKYDEALKTLDEKTDAEFQPLFLETRGDILSAQGKNDEAAGVYEEALKLLPEDAPQRQLLQFKAGQ